MKKIYGLIGNPIGHSYSHAYFNEFFREKGINAEYRNFELEEIGDVVELIAEEPALAGFNVTSPFKRQIIPYITELSPEASKAQAVNTVRIERGDKRNDFRLYGYNTDISGFRRSVEPLVNSLKRKALILGTGGASCAAEIALDSIGFECIKVSRDHSKSEITYDDITREFIRDLGMIVNATPLGMHPLEDKYAPLDYKAISSDTLCIDMVYNPSLTGFMKRCVESGAAIKNGYSMLLNQAKLAWEIWNRQN